MLNKKNLKNVIKNDDLYFNDLEDIEASIHKIDKQFSLNWYVVIRSTPDESDFWLECDYYSKKIGKTIVFNTDFINSFNNIDDFVETILQYDTNIKNFENNLKYAK